MAAIFFAASKFHEYIYAKGPINFETDHRPLEGIFKKPILQMSPRIHRMMLKVQKCHLKVQYTSERELYIADMLSRACIRKDETLICAENYSMLSMGNLPCSQSKRSELKEEILKVLEVNILRDTVSLGWAENNRPLHPQITQY